MAKALMRNVAGNSGGMNVLKFTVKAAMAREENMRAK